jgi:hypothetical protein
MGVASYDPESGTWSDEGANKSFNRNSGYEPGGPEMGYKQPSQRPELDPRDFPQTDLQIIPVTPTREEERKDRWNPAWNIDDVIKNGNKPSKRTPVVN